MDAYGDFAYVYDELMDATPYTEWCNLLVELIEKYGVSKPVRSEGASAGADTDNMQAMDSESIDRGAIDRGAMNRGAMEDVLASERNLVLDLGCGTGTLTELLYQKGYDMIGVDNAPSMLEIAMEKREKSGSGILYLLQDMRELELYSTIGTVVSVCDSVNYILEEDELLRVFQLVNNYLYPGGLFIFDFNTDYKYREVIGDTTIAENREDCSFIWENYYDEETQLNEYEVTIFVQEKEDVFRRFVEHHVQRGYTAEQMKRLVSQAGMELVEIMDADTLAAVTDESERVYIVAREVQK